MINNSNTILKLQYKINNLSGDENDAELKALRATADFYPSLDITPLEAALQTKANALVNGSTITKIANVAQATANPSKPLFNNYQLIDTSGTFTVPNGISVIKVLATSGGASGARGRRDSGTTSNCSGGIGGNSGSTVLVDVPVKTGDVLSFMVGAGATARHEYIPTGNTLVDSPSQGGDSILLVNGQHVITVIGGSYPSNFNSNDDAVFTTLPIISCILSCKGGSVVGGTSGYGLQAGNTPKIINHLSQTSYLEDAGFNLVFAGGIGGDAPPSSSAGGGGGGGGASYYGAGGRGCDGVPWATAPVVQAEILPLTSYGAGGGGGNGQNATGHPLYASGAGVQGVFEIWY